MKYEVREVLATDTEMSVYGFPYRMWAVVYAGTSLVVPCGRYWFRSDADARARQTDREVQA